VLSFIKRIVNKILEIYQWLLSQLLKFKYNKVNRVRFITSIVSKYFPEDDGTILQTALNKSLKEVLSESQYKKIYRRMMWRYGLTVFFVSFVLTITPDIIWITLLAGLLDLIIFQCVLFIAMQKIMMLYGQDCDMHNNKEESTIKLISIDSSGVMLGKHPLLQKLKSIGGWLSRQIVQRIGPRLIAKLSRTAFVVFRRQGLKWLSVILTKENIDFALAAIVPVTCALISGIVSVIIFVPMCNKLKKHLTSSTSTEQTSSDFSDNACCADCDKLLAQK